MDYSNEAGGKLIIKVLRERLYGNKDKDIEKADKEGLFYENLQLKQEIERLKQTQFVRPRLSLIRETDKFAEFEFIDSKEQVKQGKIMKISSQCAILIHFVVNSDTYLKTQSLIPSLRPIKHHINDENPTKRVLDAIAELREKFGNETIFKKPRGFLFFADVIIK